MKDKLDPNEILIAEFNYASESAFQANEDRLKVFNLFLVNVGTLIAAIALPQINSSISYYYFAFIFIFLSMIGVLVLLQLAKLRISWISSVKAMNTIKNYYIQNIDGLDKAFKWRSENIPKRNKSFSIAFLLALITILVNSIGISAAVALIILEAQKELNIILALATGIIAIALQIRLWFRMTKPEIN